MDFFIIETQILNNDVFFNNYGLTVTSVYPYGIGKNTSVNCYDVVLIFNFFQCVKIDILMEFII